MNPSPLPRSLRAACLAAALLGGLAGSARAQTNFTWLIGTNVVWNGVSRNWSATGATNGWTNTQAIAGAVPLAGGSNDYTLNFQPIGGGAASTNDLGTVLVNRLQFNNQIYSIAGGNLVLANNSGGSGPVMGIYGGNSSRNVTIYNNLILSNDTTVAGTHTSAGSQIILGGAVSGPGALTKDWSNTLTLANGGNNFPSVTVNLGTLILGGTSVVGTNVLGGAVVTNHSRVVFGASSGSASYTNLFTGTGSLWVSNTIVVYLSGSNDYSGGTYFSGGSGRFAVGNDSAFGTGPLYFMLATSSALSASGTTARTIANSLVFSNNATLGHGTDSGLLTLAGGANFAGGVRALTISSPVVLSGVLSNGGFSKLGSGTLTLSGNNLYSGGTAISNGTLSVSSDANLGDAAGAVTFGGGALQVTGTALTNLDGRTVNWGSFAGALDIADAGNTFRVTNNLVAAGTFTKAGDGTLALLGSNSVGTLAFSAGTLRVAAGSLQALGSPAIANSPASNAVLLINGGTFAFSSNGTFQVGSVAGATGSVIVAEGGTLLLTNRMGSSSSSYNAFGGVSGALGSLIVSGGVVRTERTVSGSGPTYFGGRNFAVGGEGRMLVYGGTVDFVEAVILGAVAGSTGSAVVAGGTVTATNMWFVSEYLRIGGAGVGTMIVSNQGVVRSDRVAVGYQGTSTGLLVVTEGGLFELTGDNYLKAGILAGAVGTISNVQGGTLRFTANAPDVGFASGATGVVRDATVEFKGVNAADFDSTKMALFTYEGENTLRLNAATNLARASYTLATNLNPSYAILDLTNGAAFRATTLTIGSGGRVTGSGAILANSVTNFGVLAPGHSPGTLTFSNNLTLDAASILNIELGGTNALDVDHLVAGGLLSLGGTLNVTLINGYTPTPGDTVDILDWGSIFGAFATVNLPSAEWSAASLYSDGTLLYAAIPEPGVLLGLLLGGSLLLLRSRGRLS